MLFRSILKLALGDATVYRAEEDTFVRMPAAEPRAIDLGRRLEPNPKMMMLPRMLELRADPLSYWRIDERIDELGAERARERLRRGVLERLARDGSIRLLDAGRDRTWTIAGELDPADPSMLAGPTLRLDDRDGVPVASPTYEKEEFLASTDERFRPVNLLTGPDGGLYVVDFARGVVQHRIYMTTWLRKQVEERGLEIGRAHV